MTLTEKNSARNCQDGRYRSVSMKVIICSERLYNMEIDVLRNYVRFWTENMVLYGTEDVKQQYKEYLQSVLRNY